MKTMTAREANAKGMVLVRAKVQGGDVETPTTGKHSIGTLELVGPMTPSQSFVFWMAAKGLSPRQIQKECDNYGVKVEDKPGLDL